MGAAPRRTGGAYTNGRHPQYQSYTSGPDGDGRVRSVVMSAGQGPCRRVDVEDGEGERDEGEQDEALGEVEESTPEG